MAEQVGKYLISNNNSSKKQRASLMGGMDPAAMQNMRNMSMMSNGMMPNDLKKAAMQNAGNMYVRHVLPLALQY